MRVIEALIPRFTNTRHHRLRWLLVMTISALSLMFKLQSFDSGLTLDLELQKPWGFKVSTAYRRRRMIDSMMAGAY